MPEVITNNLAVWTSALLKKPSAGRGHNGTLEPYGVNKLRQLILELAVRGKLVLQDPNDEPASVLLEKISQEKARLIEEGEIRKQKEGPVISKDEIPYEIPKNWEWCRLSDLYYTISTSGKKIKTSEVMETGRYPVIDQGQSYIAGYTDDGDLVVNIPGPVIIFGDHTTTRKYVDFDFVAGADGTKILRPYKMYEKYFYVYLMSYRLENRGYARHFKVLNTNLMAVPPLLEQHRIVAKVDELMALCDQLELQQTNSIETHQTLIETLCGTLTRFESQQELTQAWARISIHFDTLFTTEQSIDQLKETILQLAVMGKLVPQDSNDEPASVLLQRITAEKVRQVNEGKIKKSKSLPAVTDEEKFYDISDSWAWTRFNDLSLHSGAGWSPSCVPTPREGDNWGVLKVSAVTWGKFDPNENKALPANLDPKPEYEVRPGDFLISRANTAELVARAVVVPEGVPPHLMMSDKIIRFDFSVELNHEYLVLVNGSSFSREYYARVAGGTSSSMKNVSRKQIRNLVVALPPLAEQNRIVAKVDELMTLCNTLKARLTNAQKTKTLLADAIVEQAIE